MTIITSRTKQNGTVRINQEQCTACGLCVKVCKDFSLVQTNGRIEINPTPVFGCYGCGQCMAICPTGAITVSGREISPEDLQALPPDSERASFGQLTNCFGAGAASVIFRIRRLTMKTTKNLDAAALSPMGLPPSDVHVAVFRNRETVREFSFDVMNLYQKSRWLFSLPWVWIWRIFGKETYEMMTGFVRPFGRLF
jgi:NAD-dependent dihydropyrimidine dehydrogenase PreA subunit